ncbi:MAG TPA: LLM class flavin-dependent oxidoreductase, partial [Usitatibacter sp.]|nr:LLM class flavin-dependent oxidoreductase [Usitatibacter sp.]
RFLGIIRNDRRALPPPVADMDAIWSPAERYAVAERMALMVVGGPERVAAGLAEIVALTQADELIIASDAYERADRLRSYEIIAQAFR